MQKKPPKEKAKSLPTKHKKVNVHKSKATVEVNSSSGNEHRKNWGKNNHFPAREEESEAAFLLAI